MQNEIPDAAAVVGRRPDFLIIGAMKCGTTGLHARLSLHPEIYMSEIKEIDYFREPHFQEQSFQWYCSHFQTDKKFAGESSTAYSKYPAWGPVAQRIYETLPDVRLIYVVRDPVQRIYSHFVHTVIDGIRKPDFEELYSRLQPDSHYVTCSRYAFQLERYLAFFPLCRIHIMDFEDLVKDPQQTMKELYRFLGASEDFEAPNDPLIDESQNSRVQHLMIRQQITGQPVNGIEPILQTSFEEGLPLEKIPQETLEILKDDAAQLRKLTGLSFKGWLV